MFSLKKAEGEKLQQQKNTAAINWTNSSVCVPQYKTKDILFYTTISLISFFCFITLFFKAQLAEKYANQFLLVVVPARFVIKYVCILLVWTDFTVLLHTVPCKTLSILCSPFYILFIFGTFSQYFQKNLQAISSYLIILLFITRSSDSKPPAHHDIYFSHLNYFPLSSDKIIGFYEYAFLAFIQLMQLVTGFVLGAAAAAAATSISKQSQSRLEKRQVEIAL